MLGHDFHTAAIIGAAYLLKEKESSLSGTVRFIFQPAEESSNGACKVIEANNYMACKLFSVCIINLIYQSVQSVLKMVH